VLLGVRFLVNYIAGEGAGHVQSLILAAILIVTAVIVYAAGVVSDLISANRLLLEEIRTRQLRAETVASRQVAELPSCALSVNVPTS